MDWSLLDVGNSFSSMVSLWALCENCDGPICSATTWRTTCRNERGGSSYVHCRHMSVKALAGCVGSEIMGWDSLRGGASRRGRRISRLRSPRSPRVFNSILDRVLVGICDDKEVKSGTRRCREPPWPPRTSRLRGDSGGDAGQDSRQTAPQLPRRLHDYNHSRGLGLVGAILDAAETGRRSNREPRRGAGRRRPRPRPGPEPGPFCLSWSAEAAEICGIGCRFPDAGSERREPSRCILLDLAAEVAGLGGPPPLARQHSRPGHGGRGGATRRWYRDLPPRDSFLHSTVPLLDAGLPAAVAVAFGCGSRGLEFSTQVHVFGRGVSRPFSALHESRALGYPRHNTGTGRQAGGSTVPSR